MAKILAILGPAFIAAVAYIDPGNFATNITAGSQYGYLLLWVIAFSNLMAVLIQSLSAKLGIATGKNLPEVAREHFSKKHLSFYGYRRNWSSLPQTSRNLSGGIRALFTFNIPMLPAALITAVGSFAILELQRRGFRAFEAGISGMVLIVVLAFAFQTFLARPAWDDVAIGMFTPHFEGVDSLLLATGILGATVMPHAIYLHSSLTQSRIIGRNEAEKNVFSVLNLSILSSL